MISVDNDSESRRTFPAIRLFSFRMKKRFCSLKNLIYLYITVSAVFILYLPHLKFPQNQSSTNQLVTNPTVRPFIIHFVWIENRRSQQPFDLTALQYLSFLSAIHHAPPPTVIWFHTNGHFDGPYWEAVKGHVTVRAIRRYTEAGGRPVKVIEQEADLVKLDVAIQHGGFFVDFDVFFTGPLDAVLEKLRGYECVFRAVANGRWTLFHMGNFVCNPGSGFLKEIYRDYNEDYRGSCFNPVAQVYNGCLYAYLLWMKNATFQRSVYMDKGAILGQFEGPDGYVFRLGPRRLAWKGHVNIHTGDEQRELTYEDVWRRQSSFGDMLRELIGSNYNRTKKEQTEQKKCLDSVSRTDGTDGTKGTYRAGGTDGTEGTDGTDRADGTDGVGGTDGTEETDGTDRADGTDGVGGTNGTEGTEGTVRPVVWYDLTGRTSRPAGMNDLTVLEFISLLSALRVSKRSLVLLNGSVERPINGPLFRHLSILSSDSVRVHVCKEPIRQGTKLFHLETNTFLIPRRNYFSVRTGRNRSKNRLTDAHSHVKLSPFIWEDVSESVLQSEEISMIRIPSSHPDVPFSAIRQLRSELGRLLRLILFNDTKLITQNSLHKFPCEN